MIAEVRESIKSLAVRRCKLIVFTIATSFLLGACAEMDMSDLERFIGDVKSRKPVQIEPRHDCHH